MVVRVFEVGSTTQSLFMLVEMVGLNIYNWSINWTTSIWVPEKMTKNPKRIAVQSAPWYFTHYFPGVQCFHLVWGCYILKLNHHSISLQFQRATSTTPARAHWATGWVALPKFLWDFFRAWDVGPLVDLSFSEDCPMPKHGWDVLWGPNDNKQIKS
jgi:hypothetical protein